MRNFKRGLICFLFIFLCILISAKIEANEWNKSITCTARIIVLNKGDSGPSIADLEKTFLFEPIYPHVPEDPRKKAVALFNFDRGHEIAFKAVFFPKASLHHEDMDVLELRARLQRREENGKITVLDTAHVNSESLIMGHPADFSILQTIVSLDFENPEILTAIVNHDPEMVPGEAVNMGLLPDGVVSNGYIRCRVLRNISD